jgi:hypothetical protein
MSKMRQLLNKSPDFDISHHSNLIEVISAKKISGGKVRELISNMLK